MLKWDETSTRVRSGSLDSNSSIWCKASWRTGEEFIFSKRKRFNFIRPSLEEISRSLSNEEALDIKLNNDLWLLKEGAIGISFKTLSKDQKLLEGEDTGAWQFDVTKERLELFFDVEEGVSTFKESFK